ncbi:MAG TPA: hypothetical protein VLM37_01935 [Fibrobacteraceae bacterium]|nr:hypothetical protein [Fibrobacteraceae bacterium]
MDFVFPTVLVTDLGAGARGVFTVFALLSLIGRDLFAVLEGAFTGFDAALEGSFLTVPPLVGAVAGLDGLAALENLAMEGLTDLEADDFTAFDGEACFLFEVFANGFASLVAFFSTFLSVLESFFWFFELIHDPCSRGPCFDNIHLDDGIIGLNTINHAQTRFDLAEDGVFSI